MKFALTTLLLFTLIFSYSQIMIEGMSTDNNYGYIGKEDDAIKVGKVENEYNYLSLLKGPQGEEIIATRIGSCCSFKSSKALFGEGLLDKWEVTYKGLKKPVVIYFNPYDDGEVLCPIGFTYDTE